MKKQQRRSTCPINFALEIFGDRWTLLVIRDMMFNGMHSYGELQHMEEKIATNILADRLALLEENGIVEKNPDPSHGSKFIYRLTQKGIDLMPVLLEMVIWASHQDKSADTRIIRQLRKGREVFESKVRARLNR